MVITGKFVLLVQSPDYDQRPDYDHSPGCNYDYIVLSSPSSHTDPTGNCKQEHK